MKAKVILGLHLLVVALFHAFGYIGHYGFDDLQYAEISANLLKGIVDFEDHFTFRFPVVLFTALSYKTFGVNDFASSFPSILMSMAVVFLVFQMLKKQSLLVLSLGLTLSTFSYWFLHYSDKLMPDTYVALAFTAALYFMSRYKFELHSKKPFKYGFLLALSVLFGFMSKGTIVLILPLLGFHFINDLIYKRDQKFWLYSAISGVLLLVAYFGLIGYLTGDVAKRFSSITQNSYLNQCSYDQQSITILLKRISFEFFQVITFKGMMVSIIPLVAILFSRGSKKYFKSNTSFSFFLSSAAVLLLSSNFMSISVNSYIPMCLDPRHYLFLGPALAIPSAHILSDFLLDRKLRFQIIISSILIVCISYLIQPEPNMMYLASACIFVGFGLLNLGEFKSTLFALLTAFSLLIYPSNMISFSKSLGYGKQQQIVKDYLLSQDQEIYVITDHVQTRLARYWSGYSDSSSVRFIDFRTFNVDTLQDKKKYLLLSNYSQILSSLSSYDLPIYAKYISSYNNLIINNKDIGVSIYELNETYSDLAKDKPVFYAFTDFEKDTEFFNIHDETLTDKVSKSGSHSAKVGKYSTSFSIPLDSLKSNNKILVSVSINVQYYDQTNAELLVLVEDPTGAYQQNRMPLKKYLKAYSNWWGIDYEVVINLSDVKPNSKLSIFIFTNDEEVGYLDDFEVTIKEFDKQK